MKRIYFNLSLICHPLSILAKWKQNVAAMFEVLINIFWYHLSAADDLREQEEQNIQT